MQASFETVGAASPAGTQLLQIPMPSSPWNTLDGAPTKVIAHRGASGHLPEHTLEAYALAIEQGADLIEPDLVPTRDGVLVARHDRGLRRSTDIASRTEFSARARDLPDGTRDWLVDDFSFDELRELRAIQPRPTRDHRFDGQFALPRLEQVLEFAARESQRLGRWIGVYPELKHPAMFAAAGLDVATLLIEVLAAHGLRGTRAAVWVQCFEADPLRRVHDTLGLPTFALCDAPACLEPGFLQDVARAQHASLSGIAVPKSVTTGRAGFVAAAHAQGWQVHAWTYRDDALPPGAGDARAELAAAFELGIDAVFSDFPATAVAAREDR